MNAFVLNRHGRLVFPSNLMPELDFSAIETLDQLDSVIRRDFETKAPSGTDILEKVRTGGYEQPVRADAGPRAEPVLGQPVRDHACTTSGRPGGRTCPARAIRRLPARRWSRGRTATPRSPPSRRPTRRCRRSGTTRPRTGSSAILFDVFGNRKHHATTLPGDQADGRRSSSREPGSLTFRLPGYDPDYPVYDYADIIDCAEDVPELEALHRWAMVLHNQYPWDRSQVELVRPAAVRRRLRGRLPPARPARCAGFLRRLRSGVQSRPAPAAAGVPAAGAAVPGDRRAPARSP